VIADPGEGIVKLTPEKFFGEVHDEGKPPKYQWSGILIILVKNETFEKKDETKGIFSRFFQLLMPQKKLIFQVLLASLIYTVLGILAAFYFQILIDSVLPDGLKKTLMTLSIGRFKCLSVIVYYADCKFSMYMGGLPTLISRSG